MNDAAAWRRQLQQEATNHAETLLELAKAEAKLARIAELCDEAEREPAFTPSVRQVRDILSGGQHQHDWQNRVGGGSLCRTCNTWQDQRVEASS